MAEVLGKQASSRWVNAGDAKRQGWASRGCRQVGWQTLRRVAHQGPLGLAVIEKK